MSGNKTGKTIAGRLAWPKKIMHWLIGKNEIELSSQLPTDQKLELELKKLQSEIRMSKRWIRNPAFVGPIITTLIIIGITSYINWRTKFLDNLNARYEMEAERKKYLTTIKQLTDSLNLINGNISIKSADVNLLAIQSIVRTSMRKEFNLSFDSIKIGYTYFPANSSSSQIDSVKVYRLNNVFLKSFKAEYDKINGLLLDLK